MKLKLNRFDSSSKKFEMIPPGYYTAEIFDVLPGTASTGTNYLRIECLIVQGPYEGRHVWGSVFFTDKAAWKQDALVNAAGLQSNGELDTDDLVGKRVGIRVRHSKDPDGNIREEIASFRKPKTSKDPVGEVPF